MWLTLGYAVEIITSVHLIADTRSDAQAAFGLAAGYVIGRIIDADGRCDRPWSLADAAELKERDTKFDVDRLGDFSGFESKDQSANLWRIPWAKKG